MNSLIVISDSLEVAATKLENFRMANRFLNFENEGASVQSRLDNTINEKADIELQLQYYNYLSQYLNDKNAKGTIMSPSVIGITDQILSGLSMIFQLFKMKRKL